LQVSFTASKIDIVAAAAAHQHELQGLLSLYRAACAVCILTVEEVQLSLEFEQQILQDGQQAIEKNACVHDLQQYIYVMHLE